MSNSNDVGESGPYHGTFDLACCVPPQRVCEFQARREVRISRPRGIFPLTPRSRYERDVSARPDEVWLSRKLSRILDKGRICDEAATRNVEAACEPAFVSQEWNCRCGRSDDWRWALDSRVAFGRTGFGGSALKRGRGYPAAPTRRRNYRDRLVDPVPGTRGR